MVTRPIPQLLDGGRSFGQAGGVGPQTIGRVVKIQLLAEACGQRAARATEDRRGCLVALDQLVQAFHQRAGELAGGIGGIGAEQVQALVELLGFNCLLGKDRRTDCTGLGQVFEQRRDLSHGFTKQLLNDAGFVAVVGIASQGTGHVLQRSGGVGLAQLLGIEANSLERHADPVFAVSLFQCRIELDQSPSHLGQ